MITRQKLINGASASTLARRTPAVDLDDHPLYGLLGCAAENLVQAALGNGLIADVRFGRGPLMPKSLRRDLPSVLV